MRGRLQPVPPLQPLRPLQLPLAEAVPAVRNGPQRCCPGTGFLSPQPCRLDKPTALQPLSLLPLPGTLIPPLCLLPAQPQMLQLPLLPPPLPSPL